MSALGRVSRPMFLTCAALLRATLAHAGGAQLDPVVVLLGPKSEEATSEFLLRVQGELTADGFRVEVLGSVPRPERHGLVRDRCGALQGSIMAGLFVDERTGDVEMLFCDPTSRREAARYEHLPASPAGDPPEAAPRHAVDLLRAGLLDFAVETMRLAAHPAPEQTESRPTSHAPEGATFHLRGAMEPGAGVLVGFGGLDPSITPLLRLRAEMTPWLQLRVTGAGLGTRPTVGTARGGATVAQAFGVGDVAFTLATSTWLRPLLVLGAGAYGATVHGTGQAPYSGVTSSGAAFAVDVGIGVGPWMTPNLSIAVEAHAIYSIPAMAVRFLDTDAARLGQPVLLLSVGLAEWL